ncbi:MAG: (p)ppGpp synthase/HD superfamily hydrolase [Pseudomonadales bacterium]|jgi:(p)ppGpp synthase/HD superfamily hydrolase
MRKLLVLLMMLAPLAVAADQKIYRTEDKSGLIRFSDRLPTIDPDAVRIVDAEEIVIDPEVMNTIPSAGYEQAIKINELEKKQKAKAKVQQETILDEKIARAEEVLEQAEQALEKGRVRGGNDIVANVGGGTRSSSEFLARVEKLTAKRDAAAAELESLNMGKSRL